MRGRVVIGCTPRCWTPAPCPVCQSDLPPRGRSVPLEANPPDCCDEARMAVSNPRHLWSEHDSTRYYVDPDGWSEHERECDECRAEHQ